MRFGGFLVGGFWVVSVPGALPFWLCVGSCLGVWFGICGVVFARFVGCLASGLV